MENILKVLTKKLNRILLPGGFEYHFLKAKWYNEKVSDAFQLAYDGNTLIILLVSRPDMFEKSFKPFILRSDLTKLRDPIQSCMSEYFEILKQDLAIYEPVCIADHEMNHNRKPLVLMQTMAHCSGAAYLYQLSDLAHIPEDFQNKKIFPVCIHPRFGGYFGLRAVLILTKVRCSDEQLSYKPPIDLLRADVTQNDDTIKRDEKVLEVLRRFNTCWRDGCYRDIIEVEQKYSPEQIEYFSAKPADRYAILQRWKDSVA